MNNICIIKILFSVTHSAATQSSLKDFRTTRISPKQHLGKSPYLGDIKSIIGSIIDFYQSRGIAGKSGN